MDADKFKIAVVELQSYIKYPIEYRIAKYLIKAGYSGMKNNISNLIQDECPTMSSMYTNKIFNTMRDIETNIAKTHPYHIDNIPDLQVE